MVEPPIDELNLIDCGGYCRKLYKLETPYLWVEGWTKSAGGAWICPTCSGNEEEQDDA